MEKQCSHCRQMKPLTDFYKNRTKKDGYAFICKKCYYDNWIKGNKKSRRRRTRWANEKSKKDKEKYGVSTITLYRHGEEAVQQIYRRDDYKCIRCGSEEDLTIHHKDRVGRKAMDRGIEVDNSPDNLEILCRRCHGRLHSRDQLKLRDKEIAT